MNFSSEQLTAALISYAIVIVSLSAHEWGHAWTADKLGDDTARRMGRVTLNPLAHIDLIGTVVIPFIAILTGIPIIGWAKPVLINPDNLPRTSQRAWVTIAGPAMNLVLALAGTIVFALVVRAAPDAPWLPGLLSSIIVINISLMVFNLLPVPPLDGSKFLMYWFGMSERAYIAFARYGWVVLMVLFNIPQTRGFLGSLIGHALKPFIALLQFLT